VKAVRNAPPGVEVVEVDEPEGEGELIKVTAVSICASDFLYLQFGSRQIAGHEIAGVMDDGTAVAVEAIPGCGACEHCAAGNFQFCHTLMETALGMTAPGGMSEWFRAPRRALVPLPAGLDVRDACLVEPGSVAWHACHLAHVGPGTRVAVVGGGAIGILAAAAAQAMGADEVAIEARHPHQHEARERIGATEPSGLYDVVIETAGSDTSLPRSIELADHRGTVVYAGIFMDVQLPHHLLGRKEVALRPTLGYCAHEGRREFAEVADMLAARPELPEMLISRRYPIDDAPEAFTTASDRSQGVFRVSSNLADSGPAEKQCSLSSARSSPCLPLLPRCARRATRATSRCARLRRLRASRGSARPTRCGCGSSCRRRPRELVARRPSPCPWGAR
jgi:threonine dehydrogenase-like Zn-dependent dehydrogenase